jgi:hypothetical protein
MIYPTPLRVRYLMIGNRTPCRVIHPWEITWYDLEHMLTEVSTLSYTGDDKTYFAKY